MNNDNFENLDPFAKLTTLAPKYLADPEITVGELVDEYDIKPSEVLMCSELLCEYLQENPQTCVQLEPDEFYVVIDQLLMHNVTQPTVIAGHPLTVFRKIGTLDLNSKYDMITDANFQMIYPILVEAFIQHAITH